MNGAPDHQHDSQPPVVGQLAVNPVSFGGKLWLPANVLPDYMRAMAGVIAAAGNEPMAAAVAEQAEQVELQLMYLAPVSGTSRMDFHVPQASFRCPNCGKSSAHPADVAQGYCGACHDWTGETGIATPEQ